MKETLGIVPCTKEKIWDFVPDFGPATAEHVYHGPLYHLARSYLHDRVDQWVILSAKYGFLHPSDIIPGGYDVMFDRPEDPSVSQKMLKDQIREKNLNQFKAVYPLCNATYCARIRDAFSDFGLHVTGPTFQAASDPEACKIVRELFKL